MPHCIIEYSENLAPFVDKQELVDEAYAALVATEVFTIGGVRVRLHPVAHFGVADGHADNCFIHVHIRIGHGRDDATRKRVSEVIFERLKNYLAPVFETCPLGLSVELSEIPQATSFKENTLHKFVAMREETKKRDAETHDAQARNLSAGDNV